MKVLSPCFEGVIWLAALLYLALMDPSAPPGFSLCLVSHLGVPCPGCGIGRSISFALHGDFAASWAAHPLGIFALAVLLQRLAISAIRLIRMPANPLAG